ncbi:unnamed protein product [Rhizophagus irregularis]|nr:unnamed protein product [Rhizophagus irregularis]
MELNVNNPVVLLIGAGKSTLRNLLVRHHMIMVFCTNECTVATMLIDGVPYNIVDTPGTCDTQQGSKPAEARGFADEQRNVLNEIRTFLRKDATNNIISRTIKGNQGFNQHTQYRGVYTTTQYEEKLKDDARREAEMAHQRQIDQMRQDSDIRHRQILDTMEQARKPQERREEDLRRELDLMRQKEEMRQKKEKERRKKEKEEKERLENERQERERQENRKISIELKLPPPTLMIFSLNIPHFKMVSIRRNEKVKALENYVDFAPLVSFYKDGTTHMGKENKISTYFTDNEMSSQVKITARLSSPIPLIPPYLYS